MKTPTFTGNLGEITDFGLHFHPDEPALLQDGLTLTYRQLDERINRVASGIRAAGLGKGDRVLILWENDLRFVEVTLGVIRAGAIAAPVNPTLPLEKMREHLEDSAASALFASSATAAFAGILAREFPLRVAAAADSRTQGLVDYETWLAASSAERVSSDVTPDDIAWLPYTSGTTGRPKGVAIPHRMLLRDAQLLSQNLFLNTGDRVVISTPLFHMNAAACGLLPALYTGGSAFVLPGFNPVETLRAIEEHRCTFSTGVPAMYKLLASQAEQAAGDYSSLRTITCGSAPLPPSLIARLTDAFPAARFVEGYGMTECGPAATLTPLHAPARPGSIGPALPGFEIRVVDDAGHDVPTNDVGEIWIRNPMCTALGYYNRPEEDAKRFKPDGWFATGDLGTRDADGWFYFRGRADDRMNVGGENVYPAEVEAVLTLIPAIRDVAVVALPHDTKGEVPVAFAVLEDGADITADAVKEFFFAHGPAYAHPRHILFVTALPHTATGKLDHRTMRLQADRELRHEPTSL
ncbi:class I adenylate-forming enzyme family protein [Gordonia hydrophobica]|uniref:Class I adenylate-forming enzyme family protein n=1 Tax=Gordonia hydrophobica TaxID=40516 RepID=A0ABZ2U5E1_9ACTN|nr:class I adenylate-forming enzyme family protein [Gordonia hydrophobica]MBM7368652.1 acyl-CoA synthetase (AMP-forming)/AMP-acid ligase II [Gordonia hydrophobica]